MQVIQMRCFLWFLIILIAFNSCKKESVDLSYETIVDSSFNCEATINNEKFSFPFHDRPTFSSEEINNDSVLIVANLNYWEEPNNYLARMITISISKKFKISELVYAKNNNGQLYSGGELSHQEFSTIFHTGKYPYSYSNCVSNSCNKLGGASIEIRFYHGSLFETDFLNKFIDNTHKYAFYQNAEFDLSKVTQLGDGVVTLEGTLKTGIYSFTGELAQIQAKFKAYSNNILYPGYLKK